MQRLHLFLLLTLLGAAFFVGVVLAPAMAFEVLTDAGGTGGTQFSDPDETPLLSSPRLGADGTAAATSLFGGGGQPGGTDIPSPQSDMPFWTYSGVPAQRLR